MHMAKAAGSLDHILVLLRRGRLSEARTILERIVVAEPKHGAARELLAAVWLQTGDSAVGQGRHAEAIAAYEACLKIAPRAYQALYNRGVALYLSGEVEAARASYAQAIALEPRFAPAHSALGVLHAEAGNYDLAIESQHRALTHDERNAEFHNNLGLALDGAQRSVEAVASFDAALRLAPAYGTAWLNRGVALHRLWRLAEALVSIDHALALDESDAEAWSNRGLVLNDLGRKEEALIADERATTLQPGLANAWANRAATCNQLRRHREAVFAFERALAIAPGLLEARGDLMHSRMLLCDWDGLDDTLAKVESDLRAGIGVLQPFVLIPTRADAALQKLASERFVERRVNPTLTSKLAPRDDHDRVRLGYFSADFHQHAVMYLMAEAFEQHDHGRFQTIAFSLGPPSNDAMRQRMEAAFDRFIDVAGLSDEAVVALSRNLEVDVAVDLAGFTRNSRPGIFSRRAAPVQVNFLGYPGTIGGTYMDYLIADAVVIPEQQRHHYTEQIAYMPQSFFANARWQPIETGPIDRGSAGLPDGGFVFCCFNNNYKITPELFAVWMRLLQQVPGSVLWLLEGHADAAANLRSEAASRGVTPERLVFAPRVPRDEHLRRHHLADLFLDTLHYGAHTTTSDALRAGLPVLTRMGATFASRVAASLVTAIGTPDMIVADLKGYEALALELANHPERLAEVRKRILSNSPTSPLFDVPRFTRDIEALYVAMHKRDQAGEAPGNLWSN
jgi:protein O-GlcNAc transferase